MDQDRDVGAVPPSRCGHVTLARAGGHEGRHGNAAAEGGNNCRGAPSSRPVEESKTRAGRAGSIAEPEEDGERAEKELPLPDTRIATAPAPVRLTRTDPGHGSPEHRSAWMTQRFAQWHPPAWLRRLARAWRSQPHGTGYLAIVTSPQTASASARVGCAGVRVRNADPLARRLSSRSDAGAVVAHPGVRAAGGAAGAALIVPDAAVAAQRLVGAAATRSVVAHLVEGTVAVAALIVRDADAAAPPLARGAVSATGAARPFRTRIVTGAAVAAIGLGVDAPQRPGAARQPHQASARARVLAALP